MSFSLKESHIRFFTLHMRKSRQKNAFLTSICAKVVRKMLFLPPFAQMSSEKFFSYPHPRKCRQKNAFLTLIRANVVRKMLFLPPFAQKSSGKGFFTREMTRRN